MNFVCMDITVCINLATKFLRAACIRVVMHTLVQYVFQIRLSQTKIVKVRAHSFN